MSSLRIALAQINSTVGDLEGNARRIADFAARARAAGAQLMVTPELALCGYPPEDLLLRPDFYRACARTLVDLAARIEGIAVIVGHPEAHQGDYYNAASLLQGGKAVATYRKHRLPNYEVFDEQRYFSAGSEPCVVEVAGVRCGINICADVWEPGAADAARGAGADLLLALNASPYHLNKQATRYEVLRERIRDTALPVLYINLVGGQDELVFDGASFCLDREGRLTHQLPQFAEALEIVEFAEGKLQAGAVVQTRDLEAEVYDALVLGVRDYLGKNGFPGALIGLSGGIDSALTLAIAVDALGADRVRAVMMPSPYTAQISLDDAREMAQRLGVRYDEFPIAPAMQTFAAMLAQEFAAGGVKSAADTTEENLQARIRGMILMALSNKYGSIVLTTGNKSEMAVGYATLYGDMAGGFAVIKDIYKTMVWRLSRYRNGLAPVIPERIITRAPSAELKPDQTDQDTLPPYDVLDAIIEAYMERDLSPREIVAMGFAEADVRRTVGMLKRSEYKRRQAPVGIRVSRRGFGKDWRYPITSRYADEW
ncbi:MAG: NAD+ synthase [Betaproteobacteria bacterium]|jgi:NAD+ synthetase|nr:NAD+ synthase [Betaproteobacteria bacterium]